MNRRIRRGTGRPEAKPRFLEVLDEALQEADRKGRRREADRQEQRLNLAQGCLRALMPAHTLGGVYFCLEAAPSALLPSERADSAEKYFQRGGHNFCTLRRNFLENNTPFIFKNNGKKKNHIQEFAEIKENSARGSVGQPSDSGWALSLHLKETCISQFLTGCSDTVTDSGTPRCFSLAPWEQNHFSSNRVQPQRTGPQRLCGAGTGASLTSA